jgi:hypothetical protein
LFWSALDAPLAPISAVPPFRPPCLVASTNKDAGAYGVP